MSTVLSELKTKKKLVILGPEARTSFREIRYLMERSSFGIDLVGPPGSGKTHLGTWAVIDYTMERTLKNLFEAGLVSTPDRKALTEKDKAVFANPPAKHVSPAFFVGLDRESTKSGLIIGYRLENGSLQPTKSAVAEAMDRGGAVALDELTHAQRGIPTMFNTILDRDARASIGDLLVEGDPRARFIFMHNTVASAGNYPLPPSFASRLIVWRIGLPGIESEAKIAKKLFMDELHIAPVAGEDVTLPVPDSVIRYCTAYMREIREKHPALPLSARNVAALFTLLAVLMEVQENSDAQAMAKGASVNRPEIDSHFTSGNNNALRRLISKRIFWKEDAKVTDADNTSVESIEFLKFVTKIGVERFREACMQCYMYHLDVDGVVYTSSQAKEQIAATAI